MNNCINRALIFGVPVDMVSFDDILGKVDRAIGDNEQIKIMYANIHTMNLAYSLPGFRDNLEKADLVYCDGAGVRWGARLLNYRLGPRMTGADWIWDLCTWMEKKEYSLFFLGGEEGVPEMATCKLKDRFDRLKVAGCHHGFFSKKGKENNEVIDLINKSSARVLLVGFGSPLQEEWIDKYASQLKIPVIWAMGAAMDYVVGKVPRAPQWMLNHSLEWFYRFLVEPGRLWERYLIGNPLFFLRVLKLNSHLLKRGQN